MESKVQKTSETTELQQAEAQLHKTQQLLLEAEHNLRMLKQLERTQKRRVLAAMKQGDLFKTDPAK